jgi:hypothetical protein
MKTALNFEDESVKELISKRDFKFFLEQQLLFEDCIQENRNQIFDSFNLKKAALLSQYKINKKQFYYYLEGNVRKMFTGGFLPAMFQLDESSYQRLLDFPNVGVNWAFFDLWATLYKRKVRKIKVWQFILKFGSVLGILIAIKDLILFFYKETGHK